MNSWAKLARGKTLEPNELRFLDRTKVFTQTNSNAFRTHN